MSDSALVLFALPPGRKKHGLFTALRRYLRAQRDYDLLADLPDHMLRDMGLTRDDVFSAQRRPVRWYRSN